MPLTVVLAVGMDSSLIRWAGQKKLPSMRQDKLWRFRASQLGAWLSAQAQSCCQPHECQEILCLTLASDSV
jgi:pyridoxine/pyridoxamine 5'-phosphate oxidase